MKKTENQLITKTLKKKGLNDEEKNKLRKVLNQNKNELTNEANLTKQSEVKKKFKKNNVKSVEIGKNPFFPTKKIIKSKLLEDKYKELEKSGKLDRYISNKQKRMSEKAANTFEKMKKIKNFKINS